MIAVIEEAGCEPAEKDSVLSRRWFESQGQIVFYSASNTFLTLEREVGRRWIRRVEDEDVGTHQQTVEFC